MPNTPIVLNPCALTNAQERDALLTLLAIETRNQLTEILSPGEYFIGELLYSVPYQIIRRPSKNNASTLCYEVTDADPVFTDDTTDTYQSLGTLRFDKENKNLIFLPRNTEKPIREIKFQFFSSSVDLQHLIMIEKDAYNAQKKMGYLHPKQPLLFRVDNGYQLIKFERPFTGRTLLEILEEQHELSAENKLTLKDRFKVAAMIAPVLQAVHDKDITHGNVQPKNFLFDSFSAKIIGFEFASTHSNRSGVNHPLYAPPEAYIHNKKLTKNSDIYSFAKTIFALLTNTQPPKNNDFSQIQAIEGLPPLCQVKLLRLLNDMTNGTESMRPIIADVVNRINEIVNLYQFHLFLEKFSELIKQQPSDQEIFNPGKYLETHLPYKLIKRQSTKHSDETRWEVVLTTPFISHNNSEIHISIGALRCENGKWVLKPTSKNQRQCKTQQTTLSKEQVQQRVAAERAVGQTHLKGPIIFSNNEVITISRFLPGHDLIKSINDMSNLNNEMYVKKCFSLIYQVIAAVEYVHDHHVIHKDIKPDNLIHDEKSETNTVIDFDFASMEGTIGKTGCGTPGYAPPESYAKQPLSKKSDIFSLAFTIATILGINPPMLVRMSPASHIINPQFQELSKSMKGIFPDEVIILFQEILRKMTLENPKNRISLLEAKMLFQEAEKLYSKSQNNENNKRKDNSNAFFESPSKKTKVNTRPLVQNQLRQSVSI